MRIPFTRFMVVLACTVLAFFTFTNEAKAQPAGTVSFQVFYDNLSPYGEWIYDEEYGYVWIPDAGPDFQPYYSHGYWVMTEYGNTWVSNYPWGWAPFHYGRWTYDPYYGWVWVPGYDWGPAWVCWRWGGGYYGWAPLSPGIMVGITFNTYYCPASWWVFIPPVYIHHHHFHNYTYGPRKTKRIIKQTTIINNTYINRTNNVRYLTGPRAEDIRRTTNEDVVVHRVENIREPKPTVVEEQTVRMYQPEIKKAERDIAPAKSVRAPRPVAKPQEIDTKNQMPAFKSGRVEDRPPVIREVPRETPQKPSWERARPVEQPKPERPVILPEKQPQKTGSPTVPQRAPQRRTETVKPQQPVKQEQPKRVPAQRAPEKTQPERQAPPARR